MARYNRPTAAVTAPTAPIRTVEGAVTNHRGGIGYVRTPESELFLLVVNYLDGHSFHESREAADERFRGLVRSLAVSSPVWTYNLLAWVRGTANLRTIALMGGAEFVKTRLDANAPEVFIDDEGNELRGPAQRWMNEGKVTVNRAVVRDVLKRPDEPTELMAYWKSRGYGLLPKPVKRGIADAALRMYNERGYIKWDSVKSAYRFADVIELVRPKGSALGRDALFTHMLDARHNRDDLSYEGLAMLAARKVLFCMPQQDRDRFLTDPNAARELQRAGMTWEQLASWLAHPLDATAWEAMLPSMELMAIVRNARNMDQAGVSDAALAPVFEKLQDAKAVKESRMLPFRFLSAYRHSSLRWHYPLDRALTLSLANVPALKGRTLILVDRSGSMRAPTAVKSELNRADTAALFGSALALRAKSADLVEFGSGSARVSFARTDSPLQLIGKFHDLGSTNTATAVRTHYAKHDRVVIITDEQTAYDGDPSAHVPENVPMYTWNLAGYRYSHAPTGTANRYTSGGVTDAAFSLIPIREAGVVGKWPWAK